MTKPLCNVTVVSTRSFGLKVENGSTAETNQESKRLNKKMVGERDRRGTPWLEEGYSGMESRFLPKGHSLLRSFGMTLAGVGELAAC